MKCPACGCEHPPHYDRCLACDAPLRASTRPSGQSQNFEGERSQSPQQPDWQSARGQQRGGNSRANRRSDPRGDQRYEQFETDEDFIEDEPVQADSPIRMRRGRGNSAKTAPAYQVDDDVDDSELPIPDAYRPRRRPSKHRRRAGSPALMWLLSVVVVLGAGAGAAFFFLKTPDDQRLAKRGEKELANAQYAFAVQTLTKASEANPKDAKILLQLARAYVGIDQVDKAWDCISRAQKLGTGVIGEPSLASDLANYYRRRGKYDKAVSLLRPLAQASIHGKKAELADLDAAWGDELLADGKLDQALHCWEEVRELRDGSRFTEAEARLATIYQKLATNLAAKSDDEHALSYLTKLNNIAQNARNYELAAQIYEREGKLDEAIEQLRKAANLSSKSTSINQKLAGLLSRRGKELLDAGNSDAGYAFLQQAKDLNPQNALPTATLRAVATSLDGTTHQPKISGELWNPSDKAISSLTLKVELWDDENSKSLWDKEERLVDQFTPPLGSHESRRFEYQAPIAVTMDGEKELRTYIDGALYKEYRLGAKSNKKTGETAKEAAKKPEPKQVSMDRYEAPRKTVDASTPAPAPAQTHTQTHPTREAAAPTAPVVAPAVPRPAASSRGSSEEKTMKDLEF